MLTWIYDIFVCATLQMRNTSTIHGKNMLTGVKPQQSFCLDVLHCFTKTQGVGPKFAPEEIGQKKPKAGRPIFLQRKFIAWKNCKLTKFSTSGVHITFEKKKSSGFPVRHSRGCLETTHRKRQGDCFPCLLVSIICRSTIAIASWMDKKHIITFGGVEKIKSISSWGRSSHQPTWEWFHSQVF